MKILIYGSTLLTEIVVTNLTGHELVGYVPSHKPFIEGNIDLPQGDFPHDIKLSIQYDRQIPNPINAFNLHTGLLPYWGGVDILYHTKQQGFYEQGLTFHKMTDSFDYGPIISKITYPVLPDMSIIEMYHIQCLICTSFVKASLNIIDLIGLGNVDKCFSAKPILYKKGMVSVDDTEEYKRIGADLQNFKNVFVSTKKHL